MHTLYEITVFSLSPSPPCSYRWHRDLSEVSEHLSVLEIGCKYLCVLLQVYLERFAGPSADGFDNVERNAS